MKKLISFFILLLFISPLIGVSTVNAEDLKTIGSECLYNVECASGDCEESSKTDPQGKTLSFCDCDDEQDCVDVYGDTKENWICKDGANSTWDLDYCLNQDIEKTQFPIQTKKTGSISEIVADLLLDSSAVITQSYSEIDNIVKKPQPKIAIPGLSFSEGKTIKEPDGNYLYIPFLGEYIGAIYKYLIIVAGIIATAMIIKNGFDWAISGGEAEKITHAKTRIGQSLMGLFIAVSSYFILYTINPNLVEFKNLRVRYLEKIPIESMVFENHDPITPATPTTGSAKGLATTAYDATFQAFANCAGIDWRIYKAFAYKESGLNPEAKGGKTGKFIGLFQVFQPYCKDALKKIKWDIYCDSPGLTNPWVNNAYAALLADKNVAKIEGTCSSTSAPDKFFMLYIGHNCGPGALSSLLKIGCDINKWMASPPGNCSLGKMNFAKSVTGVIQQLGASSFKTAPENSDLTKCPFKSGLPNINSTNATDSTTDTSKPTAGGTDWTASCPSSPHKILAVGDSITADANSYIDQLQKGCGGKISFEKIAKSGEQTLWMYDQIKDKQNLQSEGFTDLFILGGVNDIASGVNENAIKKRLTNIYNFGKNQQLKVTAITIIPWKTYPTWTPPDQAITENVNSWIKSQQGNLIDEIIDYYSLAVDTNDPGAAKSGWTKDGLHPSKTGHKALAEAAAASL